MVIRSLDASLSEGIDTSLMQLVSFSFWPSNMVILIGTLVMKASIMGPH